jgi:hypothetical protein
LHNSVSHQVFERILRSDTNMSENAWSSVVKTPSQNYTQTTNLGYEGHLFLYIKRRPEFTFFFFFYVKKTMVDLNV